MANDQKNNVQVFSTVEQLNQAAAELLVDIAKKSVAATGRFVLCLSGGNTPKSFYSLLSLPPYRDEIPWKNTFIFWGDERCVPANDDSNNAHMATTTLLQKINIPASNIFPVPVNVSPALAATTYEKTIKDFFGDKPPQFNLILLGLGENGHTASIFPHTQMVNEQLSLVKEVYVTEQKMFRITMTAPLINMANTILFLVTGNNKAQILKTILSGTYQPDNYPAQLINPLNGALYWFADSEAASLLTKKELQK